MPPLHAVARGQNCIPAAPCDGKMAAMSDAAQLESMVQEWIRQPGTHSLGEVLLELHALHFEQNAPYRAFCQSLGVPATVEDWRRIPGVPQEAFKHADLRSFPVTETSKTFHTSGTTGEGFGRHHFRTLAIYETSVREGWHRAGMPSGPFLVIAPHPDEAPHSSLSHMLGTLAPREAFIAPGGAVDLDRLRRTSGPVCVLGTALAFLHVCEQLGDEQLVLPPGSTAMETGGYKGSGRNISRAELYNLLSRHLGIAPDNIFNEYGMTELSSQFYARGPQGLHHGPPWAQAQVVDPVTLQEVAEGETGILLVYDAANVGSVVGLRTQDLAIKRGGSYALLGRDPAALPRGCSRTADEWLNR
jgi:hypothetical protein